ncbi:MAG: alanine--glyoxylate aminotransferase family protein [Candidatus Latescibacteria bacterium]|nr:alanine--glyoxylate aminotransferase family protein [Candidatus Latescibacterota bacterium]
MSINLRNPILMIPGPMDAPDEILRRCGHQVFPHYDAPTGFPEFHNNLAEKLKVVFGLENGRVFIPSGSGTLAVNMTLASLCTPDREVLIIDNGCLRDYAATNLKCLGVPYAFVSDSFGKAMDADKVRDAMKKKRHQFIYMTHNESSTAVVNPITPIGEIAREFDALLIVDSISGVGGVVVDMGENGADVVAGASQKCFELPPGLAPVAVGSRAWDYMRKMKDRRVPYYLDFLTWENAAIKQRDEHPQLVTGNTNYLYALDWSADRIIEEGIVNRQERFRAAGKRLVEGMTKHGFRMSADPKDASPVVTDFYPPDGILGNVVRSYYLEKHNTMVGYGFAYKDKDGNALTFRIAHFGLAAEPDRVEHMINITREFVREHLT